MSKIDNRESTCECGEKLNYIITPFLSNEKRICPNCGRIHYVDTAPIDWNKVCTPVNSDK